MKIFIFQESEIWEAGNPVDPTGKQVKIVAKTEEKARRKLRLKPTSSIGRRWILVSTIIK